MSVLIKGLIVVATVIGMELVALYSHKYIMHGFGWGWHESHHRKRHGRFEQNDWYAVVGAGTAISLFALSPSPAQPLFWVAVGVTAYGALYFLLHDGLVHRRLPFMPRPRRGYLGRLVEAHHLHHAVHTRQGAVSFGFLYAPPTDKLRQQLAQQKRDQAG